MKREIIANVLPEETRIAVLEDGQLAEFMIERPALGMAKLVGNIYKGKIENVLPGISSAFVNTGFEKNAYLYVTDVVSPSKDRHIEKMLKRGEEMMVQVAKEAIGTKGMKVTMDISLPGRYLIYMPKSEHVGVSKHIEDPAERERLRRIVDEFSRFARMPEPDRKETDLVRLLRDAVTLQEAGQPGVRLVAAIPAGPVLMDLDATMISQALTNLIKNAGEAIETLQEKGAPAGHVPEIRVEMTTGDAESVIRIMDNGIGLPPDRARLFEPYVTTREKGTGLGLPIVKKIIEEHGGHLALLDAPVFDGNAHAGAMAEIRLPRLARRRMGRNMGPQLAAQEG